MGDGIAGNDSGDIAEIIGSNVALDIVLDMWEGEASANGEDGHPPWGDSSHQITEYCSGRVTGVNRTEWADKKCLLPIISSGPTMLASGMNQSCDRNAQNPGHVILRSSPVLHKWVPSRRPQIMSPT